MFRTDIFRVGLKKSLNSKATYVTELVSIEGKWMVVFAWSEFPNDGFMVPQKWVEVQAGELKEHDSPEIDCWCMTPMDPKDIFRLPSIESEAEEARKDLPPEWLFAIPTS